MSLLVCVLSALGAVAAGGQPVDGPRETVDEGFTTTRASSPTGLTFTGVYHAAGDPRGNPPYLRRMITYLPQGMRIDTGVPDRCTATDTELSVLGPDACPAGSRLGAGTLEGLIFEPVAHDFVFDHFQHELVLMNNADELIILVKSEGYSVARGQIRPDGSIDFVDPACFPVPPTGQCPDDYVMQLKASTVEPAFTRASGGRRLSYATTPPACPADGSWSTAVRLWWSDGSTDRVVSRQPCAAPRHGRRQRRSSRGGRQRKRHRADRQTARRGSRGTS